MALQGGAALVGLINKYEKMSFPPSGTIMVNDRQGRLDQGNGRGPLHAKSIVSYVMGYLRQNFLDDKGREVAYKPYVRLGIFGDKKKMLPVSVGSSNKIKDDKSREVEKEFEVKSNEELLKQANDECPICHGPGIKRGKCDVFCLGSHGLVEGTCEGD